MIHTCRKTGQPYHNVIVWNDTRTRAICEELKRSSVSRRVTQGHARIIHRTTQGEHPIIHIFPVPTTTDNPLPHHHHHHQVDGIDRFRAATGLPIAPYFSASKILWLLEHVPGLREAAAKGEAIFGTLDTWLIYKLTGGFHASRGGTGLVAAARLLTPPFFTFTESKSLPCPS